MKSPLRTSCCLALVAVLLSSCSVLSVKPPVPPDWTPRGSVPVMVAMAPGGGSDRSARVIAQTLNELDLGFDANVENKDGGSGAVGWATFMSEEGNGNTLLIAETALNTLPLVYEDVPFTYKSFTPLVMFAKDSRMVVARKDAPYNTCPELVEASADHRVIAGSSGRTGADALVTGELEKAGGTFDIVPYGSTGEVLTGLLGGQIEVAPASAASAKPYLESGDFKALCTLSEDRYEDPVLADVPTAIEQGMDATVVMWRGVFGAGDIADVQRRYWIDKIEEGMRSQTYRDYLEADMLIPANLSGEEFASYLDDYDARMREVF
ncbi:tripartite tricarboxylate transporter substrate binding protein [Prauserella cavernicola]|uniref:Tripartite tricarboxylate transporter substrate binding protein n=1 Tax=Prauserella cavernicola TaxID=2800127 RepID=A0A934QLP3_9PSEU|nr:tripartite tricarboxylate transporter substrate binding protein [Prauserella cavernicola]MBK1783292.1 tripartite tricarboxylate transporter substrate binding protein [Prauserella cavernicola]